MDENTEAPGGVTRPDGFVPDDVQASWFEAALSQYPRIPTYMHESMVQYLAYHVPTGDFLYALLSNDLTGAVARGDDDNQRALADWVKFLWNHAPAGTWGSPDAVDAWLCGPVGEVRR